MTCNLYFTLLETDEFDEFEEVELVLSFLTGLDLGMTGGFDTLGFGGAVVVDEFEGLRFETWTNVIKLFTAVSCNFS